MRRPVRVRVVHAVMLGAVVSSAAACSKEPPGHTETANPSVAPPAGSTAAVTPPAAAASMRPAGRASIESLRGHPDAIRTAYAAFSPGANTHMINVRAKGSPACGRPQVRLWFTAEQGSGALGYERYAAEDNTGTIVGVIFNKSKKCDSDVIPIPKGDTVLVIVSGAKGNTAARIHFFDVSKGSEITTAVKYVHPCSHPADQPLGDHLAAKPPASVDAAVLCNHVPPPNDQGDPNDSNDNDLSLIAFARPFGSVLLDDWTVWYACGPDCCYGDGNPGGQGGKGGRGRGGMASTLSPANAMSAAPGH